MADRIRVVVKDQAPVASRPWTSHYDPGVPATLEYPDVPLHALLEDAARSRTDATATIFFGRRRSFRDLQRDATFFSAGLRRLGIGKGDRVALMLPNCPQFLIAFFGALRIGAVVVPCDPQHTAADIRHRLADSGATAVVVLSQLYPVVKAARAGTVVRSVIVTYLGEEMPRARRLLFALIREGRDGHRVRWRGDPGTFAFRDLLDEAGEPVAAPVAPDDLAVLQYTRGTTGMPKGAMLSHRALLANTLQCRAWLTDVEDGRDTIMALTPLFDGYGLTSAMGLAVQSASALVLGPQIDVARVSTDAPKHPPLTSGHRVDGYGLAEAAGPTLGDPMFGHGEQPPGSVGVPLPDVLSRIVDLETGERDLPPGEVGELLLSGPQLMDGYYGRDEETSQTIRRGWLHTGDVAYADEDGFVFVVERRKS